MHIFIDESGTFTIPQDGGISPCIVGALIVPEFKLEQICKKYRPIRQNLPKDKGEVKGRLLSEPQVAKVVDVLRRNSCIYATLLIEMSLEDRSEVEEHRAKTAQGLTENLTDEHQPELVKSVWEHRAELEAMALPLYVQYTLMSELLAHVIREVPVYWAQRRMQEILNFHWVVDGKGEAETTKSEDWWRTMKAGMLQSRLAQKPMLALEGIDYAAFDNKFRMPMPDYLKESILPYDEGLNLQLLLNESFKFSSGADFGLELVDIVTNATRRALKANLAESGWSGIPRLMIHKRDHYLRFRSISKSASPRGLAYGKLVAHDFARGGRTMLTK